tara:strand:- start:158 stop:355 length:198 start_codon:yes stop_codon:yes gene_type:complete
VNEIKDAYRCFWMCKGHLETSHETIMEMYPGYFKRLWYNEEAYIHAEGFEEAWEAVLASGQIKGI